MNERLGIAFVFPPLVATRLARAAAEAQALPKESISRKRVIENAVAQARQECPSFFADGGSEQQRGSDWGGLAGGKVH
jgi:hypothetical protein